jgi:hypothetical protein
MYVHIDNHVNWKNHVEQILPKLSVACFSIRNLIHSLNLDILHMLYFVYFHSLFQYGIIFWGNSTHAQQVFKLQKRVVRVMSGAGPRSSCRSLFRKLNILPTACQYLLSLMLFIVDNQKCICTWYRHQKEKSFIFTCCKFIMCSKRSFIVWDQTL